MKGNAYQLIAEATNLLRETSCPGSKAMLKTERIRSEQKQERSLGIDNAQIDSEKSLSAEQSFWFKLAESVVRGSE